MRSSPSRAFAPAFTVFPAATLSPRHEWRNAIGDPDNRPPVYDPVWRAVQPNDIGTDEFFDPTAYGYRGRFELTMTSYALKADDLIALRRELDRDNLDTTLQALGGDSGKAITELIKQVETLVGGPVKEQEPEPNDPNPFTSLFAFKKTFESESKKIETGGETLEPVVRDSEIEQVIRSQAILDARRRCLQLYNRCKSILKMPGMDD